MSIFEKTKKSKKKDNRIKEFVIDQYALLTGISQGNFKHIDEFFKSDSMGTLTLKKIPSEKDIRKNLIYFKRKVDYHDIHLQFVPLVTATAINNLPTIIKGTDKKRVFQSLFGFSSYIDGYNHTYLWELHHFIYKAGTGKINDTKILYDYASEVNGNIDNPGIVFNSVMALGYHLTTTKKYKGLFLKHLDKFNENDIAKAISKLGKETRSTLKSHNTIDPMAKLFLDVKMKMPDKGMSPDEKFGFKVFMYGLFMLRSHKAEKLVFKYI